MMTVYVDDMNAPYGRMKMVHLWLTLTKNYTMWQQRLVWLVNGGKAQQQLPEDAVEWLRMFREKDSAKSQT